jgi:hypothetical protein
MGIDSTDVITWFSIVITWLAGIFGVGKAFGALSSKVALQSDDIDKLKNQDFVMITTCNNTRNSCTTLISQKFENIDTKFANIHSEFSHGAKEFKEIKMMISKYQEQHREDFQTIHRAIMELKK